MAKFIVGLTGGIGSGKTTVANMFAQCGVTVVDADIVAREVVAVGSPALLAIAEHFGDEFITANGELNRALLRQQIFNHEPDKYWLNNLLHPLIRAELVKQSQAASGDYCLLVAPLLFENNLTALVDRIVVVDISEAQQIARTRMRDNNSTTLVKAIIASQVSRATRLAGADDVINNNDDCLVNVNEAVLHLHQYYLTLAREVRK